MTDKPSFLTNLRSLDVGPEGYTSASLTKKFRGTPIINRDSAVLRAIKVGYIIRVIVEEFSIRFDVAWVMPKGNLILENVSSRNISNLQDYQRFMQLKVDKINEALDRVKKAIPE